MRKRSVSAASARSVSAASAGSVSAVRAIASAAVVSFAVFAAALYSALYSALFCTGVSAADGNAAGAEEEKTEVFVSVTDVVVAHTAMDNPVKYALIPREAEESARVKISYLSIKSLSDSKGKEVSVPRDIGKYLVRIEVSFSDPRYFCVGKYLIYEIAEKQGAPLSAEEAKRSVPTLFRASVENKRAVYSVAYKAPEYSFNIAAVKPRLMYSHIYANGSTGEYSKKLPQEPGDYAASCFVLDTEVGRGRLTVNKLALEIEMEPTKHCVYTPKGIEPPLARAVIPRDSSIGMDEIEFEYKAYIYENETAGKSVAFPLKECGSYLVSASPADTAHFTFSLARCELVVEKARPVVSASGMVLSANSLPTAVCVEDLLPKPLVFSVSPDFAEWSVSYCRLEDGVPAGALSAPPVFAGDYLAVVTVKGSECVVSETKAFGIRIEKPEVEKRDPTDSVLNVLCVAVASAALLLGAVQIAAAKHRKGAHVRNMHGGSAHGGSTHSGGAGGGSTHSGGAGGESAQSGETSGEGEGGK